MRSPSALFFSALAAFVIFAVAPVPAASTANPTPSTPSTAPTTAARRPDALPDPRPILVDENGEPYRIRLEPKRPGEAEKLPDGRLRFRNGATVELVAEDERTWSIKERLPVEPPPSRHRGPDPATLAAIAATYATSTGASDRLELVAADEGLPRRGQWRNGFDLADLDGDGRLDVVFGPARKGRARPNLFLQTEPGRFRADLARRFPAMRFDYGDAAAADFDGDGRLDLAFAFHLLGVAVLVDDGKGGFAPWSRGVELAPSDAEPSGEFSSRALAAVDWNRDGRPDLAVLGDGPKLAAGRRPRGDAPPPPSSGLRIYLNAGDGSWTRAAGPEEPEPVSLFGDSLVLGDFDRDGRVDVVVGARRLDFERVLGHQNGDGSIDWRALSGLRPQSFVLALAAGDVDGDGWLDLAVAYQSHEGIWRGGVDLLWGGAGGFVRQGLVVREGLHPYSGIAIGDVDGDGRSDVVAAGGEPGVAILLAEGSRRFVAERTEETELGPPSGPCGNVALRVADLDGDGANELVAAFAGEPQLQPMTGVASAGCQDGGAVRVFRPRPRGAGIQKSVD